MERTHRVGARISPLALKQIDEALGYLKKYYPDIKTEIVGIETCGDKDSRTPISDIEGTDFFTREIEAALLKSKIDFAVHSAKDLPNDIPDGLCIAAITELIDPYDALVSKNNLKLGELPHGARIGTSSFRRKTQLKVYRNDFQVVDIRGNIEERLRLLDSNEQVRSEAEPPRRGRNLDAIVIAACALVRLGLESRVTERVPLDILKPHPLQGALAVEARADDFNLIDILSSIDSRRTVKLWAK